MFLQVDKTGTVEGLKALLQQAAESDGVALGADHEGVSRRHCSLYMRNGDLVLADHSRYGTFVNDERVHGTRVLRIGDRVRVGTPGEELLAIALGSP